MSDEGTLGMKFDGDKLRVDLVPVETIVGIAKVLTFGAKKYGDDNWKLGINFNRIYGAILRHLFAYRLGEILDPETGLPHLYHAQTELSFLSYYEDHIDLYKQFNNLDWSKHEN